MTTSSPPNARPDWNEPLTSPATDGDDVGWLITFSDLVLQLFAFVLFVSERFFLRGRALRENQCCSQ